MLSDSAILRKLEHLPKHTAGYKQFVREFGLHGDARRELSERLERLVAAGQLVQLDSDRYALPQPASGKSMVAGKLSMHRDGFGFVTPDPTSLKEPLKSRLSGDIFIPPPAVGTAMHGDLVLVEITNTRPDGRAEGRIIRPVNRAHATVVGIFHYGQRRNYVTPIDQKISQEIIIPLGLERPDSLPSVVNSHSKPQRTHRAQRQNDPHRVLGEEAARRTSWDDLENVVVDVEITDWPSATQNPRGKVVEILGYQDDFGVDVEIIIRKFHLPHRFPAEVLAAAQAVEPIIHATETLNRRDFRDLPIVTIDGEAARDFDDAVTVRRLDNGNFELQVHIADVAHYVTPGSALDHEARLRGTSVYFPDRAVPMLPLELSTDICSLRPQVDRLVLSCVMEIDHHGEIVGYDLSEGIIRSAERMTYTDVSAVLAGNTVLRQRYATLVATFEMMRELALILNRKRERRGSIDFDLPEPIIEFDEHGLMKSITRSERNIAHRLIEEFMLSANECVAGYLESRRIASLYRIHEKPDAKRVYDFEVIAATFGYSLGVGALPIQRMTFKSDRRSSYGTGKRPREIEIPKEVHITPRMYQKLTEKIAGKPEERILSYLMLRSLKQARYSEENLGHFALAAPTYTHFTSPIRRYPDLIVHRITKTLLCQGVIGRGHVAEDRHNSPWTHPHEALAGIVIHRAKKPPAGEGYTGEPPIPESELAQIAEETSQTERRAAEAERELVEWKKIRFMEDKVGEEFAALVLNPAKFGLFVELTDLFVEGLVPIDSLRDDRYTWRENTHEIIGERWGRSFRAGDRVQVILDRILAQERRLQFSIVEEGLPLTGKKPAKTPPRPKKKTQKDSSTRKKARGRKGRRR
jgi:ribonuclease R